LNIFLNIPGSLCGKQKIKEKRLKVRAEVTQSYTELHRDITEFHRENSATPPADRGRQ
jgi:hypothetical protein